MVNAGLDQQNTQLAGVNDRGQTRRVYGLLIIKGIRLLFMVCPPVSGVVIGLFRETVFQRAHYVCHLIQQRDIDA